MITWAEGGTGTYLFDPTGAFVAERRGELDRLAGLGDVEVTTTNPARVDSDPDLARPGFFQFGIDDLQLVSGDDGALRRALS